MALLGVWLAVRMLADGVQQLAWLAWTTPFGLSALASPYADNRITPFSFSRAWRSGSRWPASPRPDVVTSAADSSRCRPGVRRGPGYWSRFQDSRFAAPSGRPSVGRSASRRTTCWSERSSPRYSSSSTAIGASPGSRHPPASPVSIRRTVSPPLFSACWPSRPAFSRPPGSPQWWPTNEPAGGHRCCPVQFREFVWRAQKSRWSQPESCLAYGRRVGNLGRCGDHRCTVHARCSAGRCPEFGADRLAGGGCRAFAVGWLPSGVVAIGALPVAGGFLLNVVSQSVRAPDWVMRLSPFAHLGAVPNAPPDRAGIAAFIMIGASQRRWVSRAIRNAI